MSFISILYFVVFVIIAQLILLNIIVAVLMKNFEVRLFSQKTIRLFSLCDPLGIEKYG